MAITIQTNFKDSIKESVTADGKTRTTGLEINSIPAWVNSAGVAGITCQYCDVRLLATTSEDLDFAGGVTDIFGTKTFTAIKKVMIRNAGTGNIKVGGASSNPWIGAINSTGVVTLPPGALFYWECPDENGVAVVAGTGDKLKVEATGAGGKYQIMVAGLGTTA